VLYSETAAEHSGGFGQPKPSVTGAFESAGFRQRRALTRAIQGMTLSFVILRFFPLSLFIITCFFPLWGCVDSVSSLPSNEEDIPSWGDAGGLPTSDGGQSLPECDAGCRSNTLWSTSRDRRSGDTAFEVSAYHVAETSSGVLPVNADSIRMGLRNRCVGGVGSETEYLGVRSCVIRFLDQEGLDASVATSRSLSVFEFDCSVDFAFEDVKMTLFRTRICDDSCLDLVNDLCKGSECTEARILLDCFTTPCFKEH